MVMCSSDEDLMDDYCKYCNWERNDRNFLLNGVPNNKRLKITHNCSQDGNYDRMPSEFIPSTSAGLWPWGKSKTNRCDTDISCNQLRCMTFIKNCDIWQTPAPPEKMLSKIACVTNKLIWEIEEAKRFCARLAMKTKRCKCRNIQLNPLSCPGVVKFGNNSALSSCWDDDDGDKDNTLNVCDTRKRQTVRFELDGTPAINRNRMTNQNENDISSSINHVNTIRNFRSNVDQIPHYTSPENAAEHLHLDVNDATSAAVKRQANKIKRRKKKRFTKVKKTTKRLSKK